jgi:hypothetical protein
MLTFSQNCCLDSIKRPEFDHRNSITGFYPHYPSMFSEGISARGGNPRSQVSPMGNEI